jgi:hypothetical protein
VVEIDYLTYAIGLVGGTMRHVLNTHYSLASDATSLLRWANKVVDFMQLDEFTSNERMNNEPPSSIRQRGIPLLCFSGYSGITHATAILMVAEMRGFEVSTAYVRKDGETSHGSPIEWGNIDSGALQSQADGRYKLGAPGLAIYTPWFVDDLVCSGDTRKWVLGKVMEADIKFKFYQALKREISLREDSGGWFRLLATRDLEIMGEF